MNLTSKSLLILLTVALISAGISSCKKAEEGTLTVITGNVSDITYHSAVSSVKWNGADENLAEGGICYSKNPEPTFEDSVSQFDLKRKESANDMWIGQLAPNTTYHLRAYLNKFTGSSLLTFYGKEIEFTTIEFDRTIKFNPSLTYGSVSDIEGNYYKTIKIGKQVWMAENLRATHLNDNTQIPKISFNFAWSDIRTPGYNWCQEDSINYNSFGAIYNWFTVNTGRLCPAGWHVPSDDEWETLVSFLGGSGFAASKLKETGTIHWISPNDGATNESGFTALPGINCGFFEGWWSTTPTNSESFPVVWGPGIFYDNSRLSRFDIQSTSGMNVRCMQD